jgi:tRNA (guanine-N7-)-methyltransferase
LRGKVIELHVVPHPGAIDISSGMNTTNPQNTQADTEQNRREIRSYVRRAGRLGSGQAKALAQLGPQFVLPYCESPLDFETAFGNANPVVLEIGFGMGETTAAIAQAMPQHNFLGVEVHTPGVGSLLKHIGERSLTNVRIVEHDAVQVLRHMIAPASLAGVHIFFPDPWHKKRHHKRRLVQPAFVDLLVSRLRAGGYLHFATDWHEYAIHILEVLCSNGMIVNTVSTNDGDHSADDAGGFAPRPEYRPVTKFEHRGLRLGHGVWDLVFKRR